MRASEFINKSIPFADGYLIMSHHFLKDRSEQRNISVEAVLRVLHKLETTRRIELFKLPFITFVVRTHDFSIGMSKQKDSNDRVAYVVNTAHETLTGHSDEDVFYLEEQR